MAEPTDAVAAPARYRVELLVSERPDVRVEGIHAVVGRWLDGSDHHSQRKPYSVTPLFADGDGTFAFEVNVLTETAAIRLARSSGRGAIRFGTHAFEANNRRVTEVARSTWPALATAPPSNCWTFHFLTPTTFRSGSIYQPLPVAGSVFGHLRTVWNTFAPVEPVSVDFRVVGLSVVDLDGRVESVEIRGRPVRGFVGTVTYSAASKATGLLRELTALARLAEFSGVGARTTFGLGVVRHE